MQRKCYIHAGIGKTGSSAIQYQLTRLHDLLVDSRIEYPDLSGNFAAVLEEKPTAGNAAKIWQAFQADKPAEAIAALQRYPARERDLVLSNEGLFRLDTGQLEIVRDTLNSLGYAVECMVLFRPQADKLVSSYLQSLKSRKVEPGVSLDDFVDDAIDSGRIATAFNWYRYAEKLESVLSRGALTVKWYPALVRNGHDSLIRAVLEWVGAPHLKAHGHARIINPTPGVEAMRVLQSLNRQGIGGKRFADEFLSRAEKRGILGQRVKLGASRRKKIAEVTYAFNARLIQRYCPELSAESELAHSADNDSEVVPDSAIEDELFAIARQIAEATQPGT